MERAAKSVVEAGHSLCRTPFCFQPVPTLIGGDELGSAPFILTRGVAMAALTCSRMK